VVVVGHHAHVVQVLGQLGDVVGRVHYHVARRYGRRHQES
jgi:hypothetical protein